MTKTFIIKYKKINILIIIPLCKHRVGVAFMRQLVLWPSSSFLAITNRLFLMIIITTTIVPCNYSNKINNKSANCLINTVILHVCINVSNRFEPTVPYIITIDSSL